MSVRDDGAGGAGVDGIVGRDSVIQGMDYRACERRGGEAEGT